jgi:hypothetical protein
MASTSSSDRGRINLSLSDELVARLIDLAQFEVYGTSKTEVAENLVREQIVNLIKTDFFDRARKTRRLSRTSKGRRPRT